MILRSRVMHRFGISCTAGKATRKDRLPSYRVLGSHFHKMVAIKDLTISFVWPFIK